jgi:hypothetical protein
MPDLPSHEDTGGSASDASIASTSRLRKILVTVVVVVAVVLAAVLHLTGVVGGESH